MPMNKEKLDKRAVALRDNLKRRKEAAKEKAVKPDSRGADENNTAEDNARGNA